MRGGDKRERADTLVASAASPASDGEPDAVARGVAERCDAECAAGEEREEEHRRGGERGTAGGRGGQLPILGKAFSTPRGQREGEEERGGRRWRRKRWSDGATLCVRVCACMFVCVMKGREKEGVKDKRRRKDFLRVFLPVVVVLSSLFVSPSLPRVRLCVRSVYTGELHGATRRAPVRAGARAALRWARQR